MWTIPGEGWAYFLKAHPTRLISPQKKSLRQILILSTHWPPWAQHHPSAGLTVERGKNIFPLQLPWEPTLRGVCPPWEATWVMWEAEAAAMRGRIPEQVHSKSPCLTRFGHLPQVCTSLQVYPPPYQTSFTTKKMWATCWIRPQRATLYRFLAFCPQSSGRFLDMNTK